MGLSLQHLATDGNAHAPSGQWAVGDQQRRSWLNLKVGVGAGVFTWSRTSRTCCVWGRKCLQGRKRHPGWRQAEVCLKVCSWAPDAGQTHPPAASTLPQISSLPPFSFSLPSSLEHILCIGVIGFPARGIKEHLTIILCDVKLTVDT